MEKTQRSIGSHAHKTTTSWRMTASIQTLVVCFLLALWSGENLYSQPSNGCARTYTSDADFNEGLLLSVNTSVSGSLRLDQPGQPLPFVYIPCSARGTVVRINVVTGEIVGEFASAPNGRGKDPSRTTVDEYGNVWVSNRAENSVINGVAKGSVIRIGLTIGGTRCNADGTPNATGQYLKPPFIYNTCIDRDGDGLIKTSRGLGNILPWTNAGGVDNDGGVDTAEDEAITVYTRVFATGARTIAVDAAGDIWVGGSVNRFHEKLNGETGEPISGTVFNTGTGGYGGLIDGNGILWSASGPNAPILRYNTVDGTFTNISGNGDYGLGIDPNTGEIWATNVEGNRVVKMSPNGDIIGSYQHGSFNAQGVGVDAYGNVFVAHSLIGPTTTVGHLKTDGTYVGNIQLGSAGSGPIGIAIDPNGKVWTSGINGNTAQRIDPNAGPIGANGEPIGAVDLTVDLGPGAGPYTYSDMTGFVAINATVPSGSWTVVHDGQVAGRKWGKITWTSETPAQTGIIVEARASDNLLNLALLDFVPVGNGEEFCCAGVTGRYVEIRTTLFRGITVNETPVLYDLTIECCEIYPNELPSIASSRGCNPTDTLTLPADQPFTMSFFGSDPDADQALTISANVLPAGAALVQDAASTNPVSAVFSWTPTVAQVGIYNITFQVDDIYCYNDKCPKVLEVIPCVPFSIYGVDPLVTVQCIEDKPGFQEDVYAFDECTGFEGEIETWESQTGSPDVICSLTTALGPGVDWALWLLGLEESGVTASDYFHFDAEGGSFVQFTDGTAHLFGTIQNSINPNQKFVVDFWFENKRGWAAWESLGRDYKNDLDLACAIASHPEWFFYELKGGFSTLTGAGELAGDILYIYHTPTNYYYGFQIGIGANDRNCNNGLSGWFHYDGFVDGEHISGNGDVNVDADCEDIETGNCIHNTSFTYFYRSVNENGIALVETQQVVINDTTAPVFDDCGQSVIVACEQTLPTLPTPTATDNCAGDVTVTFIGESEEGSGCSRIIERTWEAIDLCGNRSECVQVIIITDTVAPALGNLPVAELTVECDAVPSVAQVTATDNCDEEPTVVYNQERIDGNCPQNYTLVRTWYAIDDCENVSSIFTQTIHVQDTTAPVVNAYDSEIEMPCDDVSDNVYISATDNCSNVSITYTDERISGGCAGKIIRTYNVSDACGNVTPGLIQQIITLIDVTDPVIVSQTPNLNVECGAPVASCALPQALQNGLVAWYPFCGNANDESGNGNNGTVNGASLTSDRFGNSSSAYAFSNNGTLQNITTNFDGVLGQQNRTISLWFLQDENPSTEELVLCGYGASAQANQFTPIVLQKKIGLDVNNIYRTYSQASVGLWNHAAFVYESGNNISNVKVYLNGILQTTATSTFGNQNAIINSIAGTKFRINAGAVFQQFVGKIDDVGVWNRALSANEISQLQNAQATSQNENIQSSSYTIAPPVFADNCDEDLTIESSFNSVSEGCTTVETYTWTATDDCGNSNTATTVVTITDTTSPVFTAVPGDRFYDCNDTFGVDQVLAEDNCSDVNITHSDVTIDGECAYSYTIVRTFRAEDECGNFSTYVQNIYVNDDTAPVWGQNQTQFSYDCGTVAPVITPNAFDNCGNFTLEYNDSQIYSGECNSGFSRFWIATDECGNTSSVFVQYISFIDNTPPVVNAFDSEIEMPCDDVINNVLISATDNCNEVIITYTDEQLSGGCAGKILRTYTVSDACGNVTPGLIQQLINLIDVTDPAIVSQTPNLSIECNSFEEYAVEAPVFSDNCDDDLAIEFSFNSVTQGCTTVETYVWIATDNCGNSTTATTVVTITDSTPPVFINVPGDRIYDCTETVALDQVVAVDNCSEVNLTRTDEIVSGYCPSNYSIVRTYRAEDECGNFSIYIQNITVRDDFGPIWASNNQTQFNYECGTSAPVVAPIAIDNCSDFFTTYTDGPLWTEGCNSGFNRFWTATDVCDNSSVVFTQNITFIDTTEPVLIGCPQDLVLECDEQVPAPALVTAFDECDANVQVYFEEHIFGEVPVDGAIANCNLITPIRPIDNPCGYPYDWAMALFGMPAAHRYYTVENGSLVQYPDSTIHLTATMRNAMNPANGWNVDVWFAGNFDWNTWSNQSFPTSFKDDCGGVAANHPDWKYYLLTPGANTELVGFGAYTGSLLNLVHAPANNYLAFQLGDGANNYNAADNGFGGWFSYNGTFRSNVNQDLSNISGAGDFALELDCCPDYSIERQWTAIDCSGNAVTCTQMITFEGNSSDSNGDSATNENQGLESDKLSSTIAVAPNPANNNAMFTFKAAYAAKTSLEVFDMTGKKVADVFLGVVEAGTSYNVNYNVSDLATGVYTYRLTNGSDVKIERLIISK